MPRLPKAAKTFAKDSTASLGFEKTQWQQCPLGEIGAGARHHSDIVTVANLIPWMQIRLKTLGMGSRSLMDQPEVLRAAFDHFEHFLANIGRSN